MTRLLSLLLAAGCVTNAVGDRVGDSRFTLSAERCEWAHRPGDRFYAAWRETRRAAGDLVPRHRERRRVEVCPTDPPVMVWGREVQGFQVGTGGTASVFLRNDLPADVTERLVVHELVHALGGDRLHEDPAWWQPHPESVETRATCALQPEHCP